MTGHSAPDDEATSLDTPTQALAEPAAQPVDATVAVAPNRRAERETARNLPNARGGTDRPTVFDLPDIAAELAPPVAKRASNLDAPSVRVRLPALSDGKPTPPAVPAAAPSTQRARQRPTAMDLPQLAVPTPGPSVPALRKPLWPYLLAGLAMLVVGASLAYVTMRLLLAPEAIVPPPEPVATAPEPIAPAPKVVAPVVAAPAPEVVAPAPEIAAPEIAAAQPDQAAAVADARGLVARAHWSHEVAGTADDPDAPFLALRQAPTNASALLEQMPDGTRLRVEQRQGRWWRVVVVGGALDGRAGWANSRWLQKAQP